MTSVGEASRYGLPKWFYRFGALSCVDRESGSHVPYLWSYVLETKSILISSPQARAGVVGHIKMGMSKE